MKKYIKNLIIYNLFIIVSALRLQSALLPDPDIFDGKLYQAVLSVEQKREGSEENSSSPKHQEKLGDNAGERNEKEAPSEQSSEGKNEADSTDADQWQPPAITIGSPSEAIEQPPQDSLPPRTKSPISKDTVEKESDKKPIQQNSSISKKTPSISPDKGQSLPTDL